MTPPSPTPPPASQKKTAWILVAGRLEGLEAADLPKADLVVAADAGARHAAALGVRVDLWVGDFDSASGQETSAPRHIWPTDKDATDTELAVRVAREAGCTRLLFIGAFGGRFDHAAAVLLGSLDLARQGLEVWLTSGDESACPLLPGSALHLRLPAGTTLSVVAVTDLGGLSLGGVRWPLAAADVRQGSGWTISNEVSGSHAHPVPVTLELCQGAALVVWQGKPGKNF
ncbi:thiamine diphosphokinase [Deinococcus lacus]|uniref:Thiamine diphosphokinase n=1 Tax=Deinococcus lacus TaxID=392561 RepID=A0ABW1YA65_9DEIO